MTTPRPRPRKRFGQHFLAEPWARKLVAAISPAPGDVFLEIGPGTGALTLPLAATGAPLVAVEIDRDLASRLAAQVPPNVSLITGDILSLDVLPFLAGLEPQRPPDWRGPATPARRYRVVGNLPYNISTPILFRLLEIHRQHGFFADATVMLQREVADRLVAAPRSRDYGVLTILLSMHARISRVLDLPPGAFVPPPRVRSAVVRLQFGPAAVKVSDERLFETVVRTVFTQRRKTLGNAVKPLGPGAIAALATSAIDPRRRPETLDLAELARLTELIAAANRTPVL